MRWTLVALATVRFLVAGEPMDLVPLDFLPANTKVVFGANVSGIVQSGLFRNAGAGAQKLSEEWLKLVTFVGFDPLHDIDEVILASAADGEKAPALLVVRGRFDIARMGTGAPRYHGVALVGESTGVFALLDGSMILVGDKAAVRAAIDGRGHGPAVDAKLAARVEALRAQFEIWGTGERPEGFVPPTGKQKELDSIDRFEFGVRLTKGFEVGAEIHTRSVKDAEALAKSVAMLGIVGPKIDVGVKDGTIRISVVMTEEEVKKMLAEQQTKAPANAAPVVVSSESSTPAQGRDRGTTTVFVLPGKK